MMRSSDTQVMRGEAGPPAASVVGRDFCGRRETASHTRMGGPQLIKSQPNGIGRENEE